MTMTVDDELVQIPAWEFRKLLRRVHDKERPWWHKAIIATGSGLVFLVKYGSLLAAGAAIAWASFMSGQEIGKNDGIHIGCTIGVNADSCALVDEIIALRYPVPPTESKQHALDRVEQLATLCAKLRDQEHGQALAELARCVK